MIKSIFYKEWIKTRLCLISTFVVLTIVAVYCIVTLGRVIDLHGAAKVWQMMILKDAVFVTLLTYFPLVAGIFMAAAQFFPEMSRKSLKLMLHLPVSGEKATLSMLAFGAVSLLLSFLPGAVFLYVGLSMKIAPVLVWRVMLTAAVWYLAGIAAYFLSSFVILEPVWKFRIPEAIMSVLLLRVFFLSSSACAYEKFIISLTIVTISMILLPWLSVIRFREGKQ